MGTICIPLTATFEKPYKKHTLITPVTAYRCQVYLHLHGEAGTMCLWNPEMLASFTKQLLHVDGSVDVDRPTCSLFANVTRHTLCTVKPRFDLYFERPRFRDCVFRTQEPDSSFDEMTCLTVLHRHREACFSIKYLSVSL